ncbi:NADH:flavin oxidoreductase/NADH oxidase [Glaciimonas immobilis]|uniref:2,4-dienoyl-CoA reductase-like NADH-dependent reductase (Old Yellow Enzyme family) n=1 Tax=Glaciimonas immobilis TaxID=728004 RepID=A0A840RRB5_9BURK|nr:NADH:flavin oxidoreductase/NADH oxidase [Glaciimonas immobilis]KAF3998049.1 NADH:flavin oxidoreductase/NADH oxidase [Glaciimonas immobilis]MBB5199264.1 2,4-dienoyl-CoA reductase-like NADH-dependent reductase (Old Yellow Enzyme family) [Glaciimonas immobilis]
MNKLFSPLSLRSVTLPNRIAVAPMCQYSAQDGFANDWHLVHLGSRAVGGAGLVIFEATSVVPEGRITAEDLGIWKDDHIAPLRRITQFIEQQGAVPGIQLAHAGRKASTWRPWATQQGSVSLADGGWETVGPSALAFDDNYRPPLALTVEQIAGVVQAFVDATERAHEAGFKVVEIHAAHGYLLHQFFSPLSNTRTDQYGGSFENRTRLVMEVVAAVRKIWPAELPLMVRVSATDWVEGGWTDDDTVALSCLLRDAGVDLVDISTGGNAAKAEIPVGPGYQTQFAARVKKEAGIASGAVGMITAPIQAEHILRTEQADLVLLARELLRNPNWPLHAADALHAETPWPPQYARATSRKMPLRPSIDYGDE